MDSEEYSEFIKRILANDAFKNTIDKMIEPYKNDYLNLILPDWETHLKNSAIFQNYKYGDVSFNPAKHYEFVQTQRINSYKSKEIKIFTVGLCFLKEEDAKMNSFLSVKCPPFVEINKMISKDLNLKASDHGKFFFKKCGGFVGCIYCREFIQRRKKPVPIDPNSWVCVATMEMFDGEESFNVPVNVVTSSFGKNTFWAILRLDINCRQIFGDGFDKIKASGVMRQMKIFTENMLERNKNKKMKFMEELPTCSNTESDPTVENEQEKSNEPESSNSSFTFLPIPPEMATTSNLRNIISDSNTEDKTFCVPNHLQSEIDNTQHETYQIQYERKKF